MLTEYFVAKYGEPDESRKFQGDETASLPVNIPRILKDLYAHYGRFVFRGGRMNVMHPLDLAHVMGSIFGVDRDFPRSACHAFAYSAFGEIFFWHDPYGVARVNLLTGEVFSRNLTAGPMPNAQMENGIYLPFSLSDEALDCFDLQEHALFERARAAHGMLSIGECYGFVPALSLGGAPELGGIQRLQCGAHFSIVAQSQAFNLIHVVDQVKKEVVRTLG